MGKMTLEKTTRDLTNEEFLAIQNELCKPAKTNMTQFFEDFHYAVVGNTMHIVPSQVLSAAGLTVEETKERYTDPKELLIHLQSKLGEKGRFIEGRKELSTGLRIRCLRYEQDEPTREQTRMSPSHQPYRSAEEACVQIGRKLVYFPEKLPKPLRKVIIIGE